MSARSIGRDPFRVDGPALISFSGGRTSGYMLWRILQAWGGSLPDDIEVVFANTGRERIETLDFVAEVARRWSVPVVWVERPIPTFAGGRPHMDVIVETLLGFRRVTELTASRDGEPFARLIADRSYLPNPVTRYCTTELKIRVMRNYLRARGWQDDEWTNVIGFRADEPRRIAKLHGRNTEGRWETAVPLYDAGVTKDEVSAFWRAQPFDLRLRPWEGNCDLCFLKGTAKRRRVMEDHPDLAAWWIAQEEVVKTTAGTAPLFRLDTPSYARLYDVTTRQLRMFTDEDPAAANIDDINDCHCGDWSEAA